MARPPRIHFSGAVYHVIGRGNQRQALFRDPHDYLKYQERLAHYQKRYGFLLHAYILMPNHVHLLIEVGSVPLSRVMQGVQFTYAQHFNKKYKTVGHLFQGRYQAIVCEKETYLLELARYIHLNPIRAKLVEKPEDYRWSSYPVYSGLKQDPIVYTDFVLGQFGPRPSVARKSFRKFVNDQLDERRREDLYTLKAQTFLGSDQFVERMPTGLRSERTLYQVSLKEIIRHVCDRFHVDADGLGKPARDRSNAKIRHLIGYLAKRLAGFPYGVVAERFGREGISFGAGVRRIEHLVENNSKLNRETEKLLEKLRQGKRRKY